MATPQHLTNLYKNIDANHLPQLLSRLITHTDAQIPPLVPGIRSLLSTGASSLLREGPETERMRMNQGSVGTRTVQKVLFNRQGTLRETPTLNFLRAREMKGSAIHSAKVPRFLPSLFQELVVMNGHRFPTFCLLFDRTNSRVITGSDDYLIKIWSAQSGYLLFTLRGHSAVVTYMDLSTDNTMLATASDDGIVRVWDLKTSAPVAVLPTGTNARSRKQLTTVSFSPSPIPQIRYLIATSIDGYTWVWKYDRDTKKFRSPPTMLDCKTFNDSKLKCSTWNWTGSQFAVAGTDLFIRVFSTIQGGPEAIKSGKRRKSYDKSKAGAETGAPEGSTAGPNTTAAGSSSTSSPNSAQQNWGDPILIAQLDGHAGVVTSLSYSRHGNRLLSGSVDGFVRVWKYDHQSKMWTSMAIDVRDEHIQADATITAAKHMMPSPLAETTLSTALMIDSSSTTTTTTTAPAPAMAAATVSLLNDDAENTDSEMNGSPPASQANDTATEPRTGRASGDDSRIVPTMAIWSLDDSTVILTTSLGEIKIFDSATGGWIHTLKGHVRGTLVYVVDVHPHDNRVLLTAGYDGQVFLWDIVKGIKLNSWSYPDHEFLDGRFSADGLMFAVTDQEGKCTLFGAGKNPDDYKDARCFVEQTFWSDYAPVRYDADHNVVDDTTQIAPHLMERTPILDNNGRDYAKQKGPRYGLDLPVTLPSGVLEQEEDIKKDLLEAELENLAEQTLAILPTTDKRKLYKRRREFILEDDDDDDDPMTTEVPIVPLPNDSSGEEYAGGAASASSSSSESDGEDSDLQPDDGEGIPASAFVVNDDDDDDDYFASGQGSRKRRAASSSSTPRRQRTSADKRRRLGRGRKRLRLRDSDEDEDDDMEEEEEEEEGEFTEESDGYDTPRTPTRRGRRAQGDRNGSSGTKGRASGSKSQRSARPKSFANDDYPSDEALESSDQDDDDEGVFSGSSAGGSFSGMPSSDVSSAPTSSKKKKQWRGNGRKKGKAVVRDEQAAELHKWLPSDWIKVNEPRKSPYHPQIGDYVAYLRQGHSLYLKETPLRSKLNLKAVPYIKDPSLPWVTFGRVSRATYNVGPPTWCTITLEEQILSSAWGYPPNPEFTASRRRFEVEFHDLGDVPDFIVLYDVFQEGINARYDVGEQIYASFDGSIYSGTISDQVVEDQSLSESLWMAFEVSWPANEDVTNLSPWEMQQYTRIEEIIEHLLLMEEFQVFKSSVDFEAYPDYCKTVAYPICLESIQERLTSGFYRRSRAVQFDIELLEKNALTYNDPKSGIAVFAKHLSRIFKTSVANPAKPLPIQVQVKNTRRDEEDEDFDGLGSENEMVDIESEPEPEFDGDEEDEARDRRVDDKAFLDDEDEESDNDGELTTLSTTSSRSNRRSATSSSGTAAAAAAAAASPSTHGSRRGHTNGRSTAAATNGKSRSKRRNTDFDDDDDDADGGAYGTGDDNDNDDDDDDADGEWGRSSSNNKSHSKRRNGRVGSRVARRSAARVANDDEDDDDDGAFGVEEEDEDEEQGAGYENGYGDEDEDEDADDFETTVRPLRRTAKRKKTQVVDSDDDYV
ncbi:Bromodomain and WD repeat-containing protein 3 [Dissophora globulifera]|nr:Bromodomain and WD repeat-containing protein 3 [Dissophora globulifera]